MRQWGVALCIVGLVLGPSAAHAKQPTSKAPRVETAAELAAVMAARSLDCDPFLDADDSQSSQPPGGPPAGDTGECPVRGANASIAVYDDAADLRRALDAMPTVCRYAMAVLGPVRFTLVTARNWSVSFFSREYDPTVAKRLGGKVVKFDCTRM